FSAQRNNNLIQYIIVRNNIFENIGINAYFTIDRPVDGYNNDNIYFGYNTISESNKTISGEYWAQTGDRDGVGFQNISNCTIEHNDISGGAPASGGIGIWNDATFTTNFTGNVVRYNFLHNLDFHG